MKFISIAAEHRRRIALHEVVEVNAQGRSFLVATGQGQLMGADVHMEEDAAALEQLTTLARLAEPPVQVVHAELDRVELAAEQMARTFEVLPDGSAVMFLCRSAAVREAAEELLDIHRTTEPLTRH
jgi:hypothetical protein